MTIQNNRWPSSVVGHALYGGTDDELKPGYRGVLHSRGARVARKSDAIARSGGRKGMCMIHTPALGIAFRHSGSVRQGSVVSGRGSIKGFSPRSAQRRVAAFLWLLALGECWSITNAHHKGSAR